jgi:hypothetical protein
MRPNPAVQGTLRDKASRNAPDLERWASEAQPIKHMLIK